MLRSMAAALAFVATTVPAQGITSFKSSSIAPMKGNPDRLVCQKQEQIGTRLGARKVCLTVAEWNELERLHRQQIDKMQAGSCVPQAGCVKGPWGDGR